MKVTLKAIGDLREYLGREAWVVELADPACIRDLLERIEQDWGAGFPAYLWDFEKHQFRGPVFVVINKKAVLDLDAPLQDGTEVQILRAIAGG
jgi:molybdopterin converting factor small subunit